MKIIIIDDDPIVCESLRMITEMGSKKSNGEEITVVAIGHDGNEALSLYHRHQPDILLLDIQMKEKNGLDAAEEVLARYPEAKILFLTTFLDNEYIISALRMGAKGYLVKSDVASALHFSEGTVRNYLSVILEKLGLRDRTQLAVAYYKYK